MPYLHLFKKKHISLHFASKEPVLSLLYAAQQWFNTGNYKRSMFHYCVITLALWEYEVQTN